MHTRVFDQIDWQQLTFCHVSLASPLIRPWPRSTGCPCACERARSFPRFCLCTVFAQASWSHHLRHTFHQYRPKFTLCNVQVCALPQSYYQRHQANIPWANIHESNTVTFQEDGAHHREPVLNCKENGTLEADGFVSFPHALETGRRAEYKDATSPSGVRLPEVFFAKRSGESLLDGKQPPIVLVVRAVTARTGAPIACIRPSVSNPFCVATRRVKGAMKVDIPSMDQEVLSQINCSTRQACVSPPSTITARDVQLLPSLPVTLSHRA